MALRVVIRCWLIYWLLILIAPFHSTAPSPWIGIVIQLTFFISVLVGYASIASQHPKGTKIEQVFDNPKSLVRLFWLSIFFGIIGSLSLSFDRVVIQGISFSDGLAIAREKWREAGEERGGSISSVFSVLGYLFAPAFYYSIINLTAYRRAHTRKIKLKWLIIIILIVWNTILTGGRSVAFIAFIMFAASHVYYTQFFITSSVSIWQKIAKARPFVLRKSTLLRNLIILGLVGYSLYIFAARSEANEMSVSHYVNQALDALGLQIYPVINWYIPYVPFSSVFYLFTLFLGYLLHSYVVTSKIFLYPYDNNSLVIFVSFGLILAKLGIINQPDTEWFLSGSFPSLPGALFLQGGWTLMILFGFAVGAGLALSVAFTYRFRLNSMLLFTYVILLSTLMTSPVLFIFDSLMFPFILIQFFVFSILRKVKFTLPPSHPVSRSIETSR
jgi:hypothetical protein